jgi:two-component system sensor histidine kinase TctE
LEAKHRFTGNVAHQLRTPIAAIRTHLELALRQDDPKQNRVTLLQLQNTCVETTHLINQLLSLASATQPEMAHHSNQPVDLAKLASDLCKAIVPQAITADIDLGFENNLASGIQPPLINGDRALLEEALRNLVDNAIKYCPSHSKVTVRIYIEKAQIVLDVEDNGPGVPENELKKITTRFYRYSTDSTQSGCGLGLAIVREIAERHNAKLTLTSDAGDRFGLKVSLSFPITHHPIT